MGKSTIALRVSKFLICFSPSQDLRRRALRKIAALSASSLKSQSEQHNFERLYKSCSHRKRESHGSTKSPHNESNVGCKSLSNTSMVSTLT